MERPFRYVREDFFLGRQLPQSRRSQPAVPANGSTRSPIARAHATTRRVVAEHFAEERPQLQPLPAGPFQAVLRLERRITRDGMVSVDGNLYSVPNATRRSASSRCTAPPARCAFSRTASVIAVHPVLDGRGQRRIAAGHRTLPPPANSHTPRHGRRTCRAGEIVALRPLAFYDAVGQRLAANGAAA